MNSTPATASISAGRAALLLVLACTALHLLVAGRVELSGDEAHYALYGYFLDWSYFDHPPLVGWLQALILPFSDSDFALRLWPAILGILSSWALFRLTRTLFPDESPWTAFIAVALLQSTLVFQVFSIAMEPDTVLLPISIAALACLLRAVEQERLRDWLWVGALFGLAGLAKYTAVMLVASALLLVLLGGRSRVLRRPGPWLAVVVALLLIAPVLWWNWQHDWISFRYQIDHGVPSRGWELRRFLLSQAGQLVAYGPGLYLLGFAAAYAGLRGWGEQAVRYSLLLALPPLLFFGWSSGFEPTLPHWTLLGWALLAPLAARFLLHHWRRRSVRIITWGGAGYSLLLLLLLHSELFSPWLPFEPMHYPLNDLYGWHAAAEKAQRLRRTMALTPGPKPVLFAGNWSYASHIAWYVRPTPVQVTDDHITQSDLWYGTPAPGARGILVVPDSQFSHGDIAGWLARFDHCKKADAVDVVLHGIPAVSYDLYSCSGYRGAQR